MDCKMSDLGRIRSTYEMKIMAESRSTDQQIIAALKGKVFYKQIIQYLHCNSRRITPLSKDLKVHPEKYKNITPTPLSFFLEPPQITTKTTTKSPQTTKKGVKSKKGKSKSPQTTTKSPPKPPLKILDVETFLDEMYDQRKNEFVQSFMMWILNCNKKDFLAMKREKYGLNRIKSINGFIKIYRILKGKEYL